MQKGFGSAECVSSTSKWVAVAVMTAGLLSACGAAQSAPGVTSGAVPTSAKYLAPEVASEPQVVRPEGPRISTEGSWVKVPSSAMDLAGDAVAVVRAHWTGETRWETVDAGDAALEFPISTMVVDEVIAGQVRKTIEVRMGVTQGDGTSPLDTNAHYLLYLTPFWFTPGEETGQWTTANGPFGVFYGKAGSDEFFGVMPDGDSRFDHVTVAEARLGKVATVDQLLARLSR